MLLLTKKECAPFAEQLVPRIFCQHFYNAVYYVSHHSLKPQNLARPSRTANRKQWQT